LPDGAVELVAEGADEAVNALIDWAREGSPLASVTAVEVEDLDTLGGFEAFDIRH
jgi:acylphosphatase